ncbi:hypothetical protein BH11MYX1_BH11MYX1_34550 [soil metagenome]
MAWYELDGEAWQIEQLGKQLEITSSGKTTTRTFVSADAASAQRDKLVAERTLAGYRRMARDPRHVELERAIATEPELPASYSVYADWLLAEGDPRGNVMAVSIAAEARGDEKAFPKLLKKHVHYLLGPLAELAARHHGEREGDPEVFAWRFGVIHRAYLHAERQKPLDGALEQLLRHASGRFLVDLKLVQNDRIQEAIDLLAARPPTSLRALRLWAVSNVKLSALWSALPRLRRLSLSGHAIGLTERGQRFELPELERLELVDSQMAAASARALRDAPFPKLEQLRLDFGSGYTTGDASIDDVFDLLARKDLPALRLLALVRTRYIRELVIELGSSPVARNLDVLDLSHNQMTDPNAVDLARRRANFPKLSSLDVTGNRLSAKGLAALADFAVTIRSLRQEP